MKTLLLLPFKLLGIFVIPICALILVCAGFDVIPRKREDEDEQRKPREQAKVGDYDQDERDKDRKFFIDLPDHECAARTLATVNIPDFPMSETPEDWQARKEYEREVQAKRQAGAVRN